MCREYSLGSRCKHDNVIGYYGIGQDEDGDVGIAMEYMNGGTFYDLIMKPSNF